MIGQLTQNAKSHLKLPPTPLLIQNIGGYYRDNHGCGGIQAYNLSRCREAFTRTRKAPAAQCAGLVDPFLARSRRQNCPLCCGRSSNSSKVTRLPTFSRNAALCRSMKRFILRSKSAKLAVTCSADYAAVPRYSRAHLDEKIEAILIL
jgi:hypothetical protein